MNRSLLMIAIAAAAVCLWSGRTEAACKKWIAKSVAPCQVLNVSCSLGAPDLIWSKQKAFYDIVHKDDALSACKAGAKNTLWETGHTFDFVIDHVDENDPDDPDDDVTLALCLVREEGTGAPTYPADYVGGWDVEFKTIPREACCERVPAGPYSNGVPGTSGGEFSQSKKNAVKSANIAMHGTGSMKSDYIFGDGTRWFTHEPVWLSFDYTWYFNTDDDGKLLPPGKFIYAWNPVYANVDHIVPRKDKFGCNCGSNSLNNALLISAGMNVETSNNCEDVRRIKILNQYAPL